MKYKLPSRAGGFARIGGSGLQFFMGLLLTAIGIFFLLRGLNVITIGKVVAPAWILDVAALIFLLFGASLFVQLVSASSEITKDSRTGTHLTIKPKERPASLVACWTPTFILNAIVAIGWYILLSGRARIHADDQQVMYITLGVFTPMGLAFLYWSVKTTLAAIRFGLMPLHLTSVPEGGERILTAWLTIPRVKVLSIINTKLICYRVRWVRYRNKKGETGTTQSTKEIWHSETLRIPVTPGNNADISIPIAPQLPGTTTRLDASSSSVQLNTDYYAWLLEITADVPGVDLKRTYEVPVALTPLPSAQPDTADARNKAAAVHTVAEAQFAAGKSADSIADKLVSQGIAPVIVRAGMQQITDDPDSVHRDPAQAWIDQQNKVQSEIEDGQMMMLQRAVKAHSPQPRQARPTNPNDDRHAPTLIQRLLASQRDGQKDTSLGMKLVVRAVPILFFAAIIAYQYWNFEKRSAEMDQRSRERIAETQARTRALQQRYRDYKIIPDVNTGAVYVSGRGLSAEQHGTALYLKLDEIRLEKLESKDEVNYTGLGINIYKANKNLGSNWTREIRGTLTAASPVTTLHDQVFTLPNIGSACNDAGCKARLLLSIRTGPTVTSAENTAFVGFTASPGKSIVMDTTPSEYWDTYYEKAIAARRQNRNDDALRLFQETLDFIHHNLGPDDPAAARTLVTRASLYKTMHKDTQYERDMQRAYAILDHYPDEAVKKELGESSNSLDKEEVARWLGDYYWDAHRYQDSYKYYQLAYAAVPGLKTSDYSRNLKLAFSSAGVMKTACTLGKWDVADKAMAELKRRYKDVEPASQKKLDYWIRTGEPRLKNHNC